MRLMTRAEVRKVKKGEKKRFEDGGRNKDPKNKGNLPRSWKGKEEDFPTEPPKECSCVRILIFI